MAGCRGVTGAEAANEPHAMSPDRIRILRPLLIAALVTAVFATGTRRADAISANVKSACESDYFKHCSAHAVGSEGLRVCMRKVGEDLSTPCLVALVKAGEVTKEDIAKYKAKHGAGGGVPVKPSAPPLSAKRTPEPAARATRATTTKRRMTATRGGASETAKSVRRTKTRAAKQIPERQKPTSRATARSVAPRRAVKPLPPAPGNGPQVAGWASNGDGGEGAPRYTHNLCHVKTRAGKDETFTCALDEKCCYGALFDEKYCVPAGKSCFWKSPPR